MSNELASTESDWPLRSSEMPIGSMENSAPYTPELGEMPTGSMSSENMGETPARSPGEMPLGKMDQSQPSAENTMPTGNMEGGGTVTAMADAAAGGGEMPIGSMENSAPYTPELGEMPTGSMSSENMGEMPARSPGEMPLGKMDQSQPSAENTMPTGNMEGGGTVTAMADAAAGGGEMPLGRMDSGSTPSTIAEMPAATADGPSSGLNLSGRWRISIEFDA